MKIRGPKGKQQNPWSTSAAVICGIGLITIGYIEIHQLQQHNLEINSTYSGYLFAVFLLGLLWSLYDLSRKRKNSPTKMGLVLKSLFVSLVFFGLVYAATLLCGLLFFGVESVQKIASKIWVFCLVGLIFGPLVTFKLLK